MTTVDARPSATAQVPQRVAPGLRSKSIALAALAAAIGGLFAWISGAPPASQPWSTASNAYERQALVFWQALRRRDVEGVRKLLVPSTRRSVPALNLALAMQGEFGDWLAATSPTVVESEPIAGGRRVVLRLETRRRGQPVSELRLGLIGLRVIRGGDRLYVDATSWLRKHSGLDPLATSASESERQGAARSGVRGGQR
ncbi:hypothetical protein JDY09_02445 [Thermoleophilum album]|uniref:hypothetical protein n=1 Tax=Thermoleophilum album TaxID=29539 RepID=UPI00237C8AB0|nr:hypothetical protein [Thermoleophilum album]MCL6441621.1 hypothetical protein [Thermoleophilum sp.]WDT94132.1 hypothetical protein JDY09_02445 [Thermoleophilum album]